MKRSKIFLGFTACILGVAGFAATKAKWHAFASGYKNGAGICKLDPASQTGTIAGTTRLTTAIGGLSYNLYTAASCVKPLYKGGL